MWSYAIKKCYTCGQDYYYGCTHNCPTNWNTENCQKKEIEKTIFINQINKLQKDLEEKICDCDCHSDFNPIRMFGCNHCKNIK
jgi:hypothetical protein